MVASPDRVNWLMSRSYSQKSIPATCILIVNSTALHLRHNTPNNTSPRQPDFRVKFFQNQTLDDACPKRRTWTSRI